MIISGFHKFTLIDYPNKISAIIFLQGCNFRCGFCHNPELVISKSNNNYSKEFILKFLEERKEKLDAVCITGGEPLISLDLDFLKEIKNRGYSIKIDTNGSYPDKLQSIITAELVDYVAMDIKSSFYNYNLLTGSKVNIDSIKNSIKLISNFKDYEFRTTIIPEIHTNLEIKKLGQDVFDLLGHNMNRYVLQHFRKSHKMLNPDFFKYSNTTDTYLKELETIISNYSKEVIIR